MSRLTRSAELYATLSAIAAPKLRRVAHVREAVEHAATVFTPVTLSAADYVWVLRHVGAVEARSGQIYDALILKCAELAGVEVVYTWNTVHFRWIAWL